jgi:17beta-estradiol 17-dehydrogenase / very-long-chain 3-oxoacyl-CoA reductase
MGSRVVDFVRRRCCRYKLNLKERYAKKDSWALVTGASEGIGAEFCRQLARNGFNIVMVARTKQKLIKVSEELKKYKVQVMTIQADFTDNANMEYYEEEIVEKIYNLDVAIVVLGAGMMNTGQFMGTLVEYH